MIAKFFDKLDFENIGGTPVVGINANVVIGHGVSKRKAIMNPLVTALKSLFLVIRVSIN